MLTGWLALFDRRANQPLYAERTDSAVHISPGGRSIRLIRA